MKIAEVQELKHGLYKVYWKSGGSSLASVGSMANGRRWMAATNWINIGTSNMEYWKDVRKMTLISDDFGEDIF